MKRIIENIIRRRNPFFAFDPKITTGMLYIVLIEQCCRLLRGLTLCIYGKKPKGILLGRGVQFRHITSIQWGRFLKLDTGVYISALGYTGIRFGNHVGIGAYSRIVVSTSLNNIGRGIHIGNNVGIGEFSYLGGAGGLAIGDDTIIGQYFSCHPENHQYRDLEILIRKQGVVRRGITIGRNCWIGSKVTILDGVKIGDGCIIAAGATVTKSFAANAIIAGVPAKQISTRS